MQSSIYADLKKFAGKIEGKKVSAMLETESEQDAVQNAIVHKNTQPASARIPPQKTPARKVKEAVREAVPVAPEMTIDGIIPLIKPPLAPLKDARGYIYDVSTIAVVCPRKHVHKYYIKDIMVSAPKCLTCSSGNKFSATVRELIENTFGAPFILNEKKIDVESNCVEYINPQIKIAVSCCRIAGEDTAAENTGVVLVKLHPTTSLKKIKESLYILLVKHRDTLSEDIIEKVRTLHAMTRVYTVAPSKIYTKEPLPYSHDLAAVQLSHTKANPIMAQMQMNIIDDEKLCLENC